MNIVIPMAGNSKRFFDAGYKIPKYMIKAKGSTLFEYSLSSLPLDIASQLIFIGLYEHEKNFNLKKFITDKVKELNIIAKVTVVLLETPTRGQAESVLKAEKYINPDEDLIIYNIDTHFVSKNLKNKLLDKKLKKDGILSAFYLGIPDEKWSFAELNEKGFVVKTAEKIPISNYPLTGMYHFSKAEDFLDAAKYHIASNILYKNEFYIAPMYNYLIQKGKVFVLDIADEFLPLGTPEDLEKFISI